MKKQFEKLQKLRMNVLILILFFQTAQSRPRRHAYTVKKGQANIGHQFQDVAWLFANHQNVLPTQRTTYGAKNEKILRKSYSLRNIQLPTQIRRVPYSLKASSRNTDDEELMSQLMRNNLISSHNRHYARRAYLRKKIQTSRRLSNGVLRRYKHILANLPILNDPWEGGSGEMW